MKGRLFVVHGSHPCATVAKALELKGIDYSVVEYPPPMHVPFQLLLFGKRTVPGLRIQGEKLQGSRAILRRLDELVPEPALLPVDPAQREQVLEAERWGDEVFQPIGRRLLWPAMKRSPSAAPSYNASAKVKLPAFMVRAMIPLIARAEIGLNKASDEAARADLEALPGHLDKIDGWIAAGVLGGERANAADLQIGSTLALLLTIGDVRPLIEGRPAAQLAHRHFGRVDGDLPAGAYPAGWLPAPA